MKPANMMRMTMVAAVAAAGLLASGCATKKHVRNTVAPLERRVGDSEGKIAAQGKNIEELQAGVSRADERAQGAQGTADRAVKDAAKANELAVAAGERAGAAQNSADRGIARAGEVDAKLDAALANIENYKEVAKVTVLFAFDKSELSAESKAELNNAVKTAAGKKHFVIEVQGFTDKTGAKDYNLALSERRADAVVRFLTSNENVPLRAIHRLGYGADAPAADNKTRDGRKLNRRVDVKVLAFELGDDTKVNATTASPRP